MQVGTMKIADTVVRCVVRAFERVTDAAYQVVRILLYQVATLKPAERRN